jgi:GNAT superfamily N-acetyltransferase
MLSSAAPPPSFRLEQLTSSSTAASLRQARALLLEYGRFVAAQSGVSTFSFSELEKEAEGLPASYQEAGGGSILALFQEKPMGFVAWRDRPEPEFASAWEMKRLWVGPQARGLGLGRVLVQAVLDRARTAGKTQIVLDTAPDSMSAAHRLYLEMGFEPCEPYGPPATGLAYLSRTVSPA